MKPYGKKKYQQTVEGHQDCSVCHDEQKSMKRRARRDAKKQIKEQLRDKNKDD